jgi:hypothetical protein
MKVVRSQWSVVSKNIKEKPMTKAILFWLLATVLLATVSPTEAQQPKKVPRIGVLLSGSRTPVWGEAFRQALRELGYIEGQNIAIEYRNADGRNDRQSQLAVNWLP